jgi:hypothetical protein
MYTVKDEILNKNCHLILHPEELLKTEIYSITERGTNNK